MDSTTPSDRRTDRLISAWLTLVPSKAVTLLVQAIAIPIVYRAIGPAQFATYAAVTAAVSVLGFLNLGMGGALVTPLAEAAADRDHEQEARLLSATIIPIGAIAALALCVALPLIWFLPLRALFGLAATTTPPAALRLATLLACVGTVSAVPLSAIDNVRQAYQEVHISNLFGTLTNVILGVGLILTAWLAPTLPAFVAATAFAPVAGRLLNVALLLARRPHLRIVRGGHRSWQLASSMAKDGLSYMGAAALANILVYQWPVYYMTRIRSPLESSSFAVYVQLILLTMSFGISLALPLWPAVADAAARGDYAWVARAVRRARTASLAYGSVAMLALGLTTNVLMRTWLRREIHIAPAVCWLGGTYVLLAAWEYVHWPLTVGLGAMRPAAHLVLLRAAVSAAFVPIATRYGQVGVFVLLCGSVVLTTAWAYPRLLARTLETTQMKKQPGKAAAIATHEADDAAGMSLGKQGTAQPLATLSRGDAAAILGAD